MQAPPAIRAAAPPRLEVGTKEYADLIVRHRILVTLDGLAITYVRAYDQEAGWADVHPRGPDNKPIKAPDGESWLVQRLTGEVRAYLVQ